MKFEAVIEEVKENATGYEWYYWVGAVDGPSKSGYVGSEQAARDAVGAGARHIKRKDWPPYREEWEFEL